MSNRFREKHLLFLLESFSQQSLPLDLFIRNYLKKNKSIGAHDRRYIAETVYGLIRQLGLVDFLCDEDRSWSKRVQIFSNLSNMGIDNRPMPDHVRVSFPKKLFDLLTASLGLSPATCLCHASNTQAPTTVRINPLKTSRDELMATWRGKYDVSECQNSHLGIIFHKRENFFALDEFKNGFFEIQDEGSQLLAFLVDAKPGQQVLDFCSGAGGKTLAFAPLMKGKGQIYLHDIRDTALMEAKKRLSRAGIQNAQYLYFNDPKKKKLKGKMDWVLVDAPCSGTGTLRRNPDMKWRFDPDKLPYLLDEQRQIFAEALSFLKPHGKIVYATCSVLPQENMEQVDFFKKNHHLTLSCPPFLSRPELGGMDGFFGAILQRTSIEPTGDDSFV